VIERETKRAIYGSGAGITYDSEAAAELAEVRAKAAVLAEEWPEFDLLETMRAEHGRVLRLERHLARLLASARYFDIPLQEPVVRAVLADIAASAVEPRMIRMLVDKNGAVRTEEKPIETVARPEVAVARSAVSSRDRFLFHKTTHRSMYDARRAEQPEWWDVLLWNERDELTEFTRGNVVVELDRERLTPALSCGLLGGTFRAELLHAGVIHEAIVRVADLPRVKRMWFINSVREWVEVRIGEMARLL
jgi:para-aminobenzoate synthetase/4-amino-4-deoxychorismate lyase